MSDENYYDSFAFGDSPDMADELLALALSGKKTGTVSVLLDGERPPNAGDLSLVLDGGGAPACVIKTKAVTIAPFREITWDLAKLEGEEETFEDWKTANIAFWNRDAANSGYIFGEDTPFVFEEFEVVRVIAS